MSRCTGHCCKSFPLSVTYEDLSRRADVILDGAFVLDMLVRLPDGEDGRERFTCRHLSPSGDCSVYEQRPRMCRDYPYGRVCDEPDCTYVQEPAEKLITLLTGPPGVST